MNNELSLYRAFNALKDKIKQRLPENEYESLEELKQGKTIYPDGEKRMSLNGKHEFYGLQEH